MILFWDIASIAFMSFGTPCYNIINAGIGKVVGSTKFRYVKAMNNFMGGRYNGEFSGFVLFKPFCGKRRFMSSFSNHVLHIITLSTEKEMIRSNTGWIVAMMANIKGFIKRAISMFVYNTMSFFNFSGYASFLAPKLSHTISTNIFMPNPNPACVSFNNMQCNSFFNSSRSHKIPHIIGILSWQL